MYILVPIVMIVFAFCRVFLSKFTKVSADYDKLVSLRPALGSMQNKNNIDVIPIKDMGLKRLFWARSVLMGRLGCTKALEN